MHYGKLTNSTQAGRLYKWLKAFSVCVPEKQLTTNQIAEGCAGVDHRGKWRGKSLAPSTVLSQVRAQLPPGEEIEHDTKPHGSTTRHYYRLVRHG